MSKVVHGRDVSVEAKIDGDYIAIGCAISCSFEFDNEIIGKTDRNAGLMRKKRVRMSDMRGSVQGLTTINSSVTRLTLFHFLQEAVRRSENDIRFVYTDEAGDGRYIQGLFLVKMVSIGADVSSFSEFDLQLEGTGNIDIGVVDPVPEMICPELFSDYWETTPEETTISGAGAEGRSFAGNEIIEVAREGIQHDYTSGTPGNREYGYDGTEISFDSANPFNEGERVFVIWKAFES